MSSEHFDLTGRVVIVTGASSGIGAATARLLHREGAVPVLAARRADRLESLSAELDGALAVPTDVTDDKQVDRLVIETLDRYGRIDGLVNNAGTSLHQPLLTVGLGDLSRTLELSVVAALRLIQATAPAMTAAGGGRIVNVSSGTTRMVPPGIGGYAAAKSALNMLSAVARVELADDGIVVSTLLPSTTATEFNDSRYRAGVESRPGMVGHTPEYVASYLVELLRTGDAELQIPHGPERPRP